MLILQPSEFGKTLVLCAALLVPMLGAAAQTPTPTPAPAGTPNQTQRDATRPPGTEQNQTQPPEARPNTQSPQSPPGTTQNPALAPPGANVVPQATNQPTPPPSTDQEPVQPNFPNQEPRPLPPLPNLTRLGVSSSNTLTLSLNEAIRRALQNNNDIEVARDDVRFAETQLRSLQGVYQPIFNVTPQFDKRITPQQTSLGGAGQSGTTKSTNYTLRQSKTKA